MTNKIRHGLNAFCYQSRTQQEHRHIRNGVDISGKLEWRGNMEAIQQNLSILATNIGTENERNKPFVSIDSSSLPSALVVALLP
jgi:hypothetical protein